MLKKEHVITGNGKCGREMTTVRFLVWMISWIVLKEEIQERRKTYKANENPK